MKTRASRSEITFEELGTGDPPDIEDISGQLLLSIRVVPRKNFVPSIIEGFFLMEKYR